MFSAYDRKNADDDNDGCKGNDDGNFDDNDDKNDQKTYNIRSFGYTFTNFRDTAFYALIRQMTQICTRTQYFFTQV